MCGLAGWVTRVPLDEARVASVKNALKHRGPDGDGVWSASIGGEGAQSVSSELGLIHTRLAIIDLSEAGAQPMSSRCGKYVVVLNGEIYNYKELGSELRALGCVFNSKSDTEVLLQGYMVWGCSVFSRLTGMFSAAIVDRPASKVILARDPFGIKPLFYMQDEAGLFFASEVPALIQLAGTKPSVDLQKAHDYLALGQVDRGESTFFAGVKSFPAAHYVEVGFGAMKICDPVRYWRAELKDQTQRDVAGAITRVRDLFMESISLHLRSDVPVGACLSGGIDSSSIVCAMRKLQPKLELHTFSYIAHGSQVSEEKWVDQVVAATGAASHKIYATESGLAGKMDELILRQGEPFGSTSIYTQYCVFEAAREQGIKVMLDGQGADELFAGYPVHRGAYVAGLVAQGRLIAAGNALRLGATYAGIAPRVLLEFALHYLTPHWLYQFARNLVGRGNRHGWMDLGYLAERGVQVALMKSERQLDDTLRNALRNSLEESPVPQLLRYEDRNSMAHSIESRVPFLTTKLAQFAYSLPDDMLISKGGVSKWALREAMRGIVPDAVLDRRDKIGFQTPEQEWLRLLSERVEQMLEQAAVFPWLRVDEMRAEWQMMRLGQKRFDTRVWRWVNFLRWAEIHNVRPA